MFYDLFTEFDRLFEDAYVSRFRPTVSTEDRDTFRPRMDLFEAKEDNVVTATLELPGLTSSDVTVEVQERRLTISGNAGVHARTKDKDGYVLRERNVGKFSRTLQLPIGTKAEDIKAKMTNGVLTVTVPKVSPEQVAYRIPIQSREVEYVLV